MEITLKNKCCLYVIIPIRFFSITICKLLIDFPYMVHNALNFCRLDCTFVITFFLGAFAKLWKSDY